VAMIMITTAHGDELANLVGLLADATRATFCLALLDGRAWTAGELAAHARVAPSTASEHLDRLIAGGLLAEHRQGRHRYVRLAGPHVAELIEDLASHLGPARVAVRTLRAATASEALARGRTCYDHLAGRLGVALADAMTRAGLLNQTNGFALTDEGVAWFAATMGVTAAELSSPRRPMARACVDWTERRVHLAGTAGARLCQSFHRNEWIRRVGSGRAVSLTPAGRTALRELLDIDAVALALT
jgi:DNA-binding transcriptional ArsR family regulator